MKTVIKTRNISLDSTSACSCKNLIMMLSKDEGGQQLRISVFNNSQNTIVLRNPWKLWHYRDGKWQNLPYKIGFIDVSVSVLRNQQYETVIDLGQFKDFLHPGLYKVEQIVDFYGSITARKAIDSCEMINCFTIKKG